MGPQVCFSFPLSVVFSIVLLGVVFGFRDMLWRCHLVPWVLACTSCCWSRTAGYCEIDRISSFLGAQGTKRGCLASYSFCALVKHRAYMPKSSGLDTKAHCHMWVHAAGLCSIPYQHYTAEHCHTLGPKKQKHPKLENCPKRAHPSGVSLPPTQQAQTQKATSSTPCRLLLTAWLLSDTFLHLEAAPIFRARTASPALAPSTTAPLAPRPM